MTSQSQSIDKTPKNNGNNGIDIDLLTQNLSDDLKPQRLMYKPALRTYYAFAAMLSYIAAFIFIFHVRDDIILQLEQGTYLAELSLCLSLSLAAAYGVNLLSVPDMYGRKYFLIVPMVLFAAFCGMLAYRFISPALSMEYPGFHHCVTEGAVFATAPVLFATYLLKRGRTTRPMLSGAMVLMAAAPLGWGALRITCASSDVSHLFFHHFLPFLLIGIVLSLVSRKLYSW